MTIRLKLDREVTRLRRLARRARVERWNVDRLSADARRMHAAALAAGCDPDRVEFQLESDGPGHARLLCFGYDAEDVRVRVLH